MAVEITMPQLSDTMSEGKILTWLKKEGDAVKRGEALAEVATDKADLEIEAFHHGQLLKILAPVGASVQVGSVIAIIGEAGEKVSADAGTKPAASAPKAVAPTPTAPTAAPSQAPQASSVSPNGDGERVKISPLAKNVAKSHGVDYSTLKGTGEGGRIVKRDIEHAVSREVPTETRVQEAPKNEKKLVPFAAGVAATPAAVPSAPLTGEALSRMRQTIAARMVESKTTIPHFYMTTKIHADALTRTKDSLKPLTQYEGITFNHLIVKACGLALRAFPRINSAYSDGKVLMPQEINIGVVTAVTDGLLIPVLKNADHLHLADVVAETRSLVQRARSGRPKADDLVGGTFSISNVGMFPVEEFAAIISPGQGAILAIGGINEEAIVEQGQIRIGQVFRVTLSVDHRIIDGVLAGEFLKELKRLLEDPILLLA